MDRPDARSEVIQLLRMRYFLTERVYYHHTKVAAGAMISKAVELALDGGALDEADLLVLNDWTLLDRLSRCGDAAAAPGGAARAPRSAQARLRRVGAVGRRRPSARRWCAASTKRAPSATPPSACSPSSSACAEGEVIVYCPALTVMKEASARVVTSRGIGALNDSDDAGSAEIRALEARYAQLWRLYVFVPAACAARAASLAAELFGHASEHH